MKENIGQLIYSAIRKSARRTSHSLAALSDGEYHWCRVFCVRCWVVNARPRLRVADSVRFHLGQQQSSDVGLAATCAVVQCQPATSGQLGGISRCTEQSCHHIDLPELCRQHQRSETLGREHARCVHVDAALTCGTRSGHVRAACDQRCCGGRMSVGNRQQQRSHSTTVALPAFRQCVAHRRAALARQRDGRGSLAIVGCLVQSGESHVRWLPVWLATQRCKSQPNRHQHGRRPLPRHQLPRRGTRRRRSCRGARRGP